MEAGSELMRLVETERQLDVELAEARTLAATLVANARAETAAREQGLSDEVHGAIEQARLAIERRLDERLASIDAEARRAALLFDAATPATVQDLARRMVERLLKVDP